MTRAYVAGKHEADNLVRTADIEYGWFTVHLPEEVAVKCATENGIWMLTPDGWVKKT